VLTATRRDIATVLAKNLRNLARIVAAAGAAVAVQLVPLAAHADTTVPIDVTTIGTDVSTCQLSSHSLFDSPLTATVTPKPGGETDFVWHAAAHAAVSSADTCVTGIMVKTQLTDSTSVPNCPVVLQSLVGTSVDNDPFVYSSTGKVDYEVDNHVDFDVPYFDAPSTTASTEGAVVDTVDTYPASFPDVAPFALPCDRVRSTVTESDTAYYANSAHQFVPYCSQQVSYDFVSTPAGPKEVGDPILDSITC
jgi:hypothetical protein